MTSRRRFLAHATTTPLALLLPATSTSAADLSRHRGQLRIRAVEAFAVPRAVFAKVTADDGSVGWGECGHSGGSHVARLVNEEVAGLAQGQDVFGSETLWRRLFHELDELGPGGLASQAIAGVDCALWDLRGRVLGLPVCDLLGGRFRTRIPLYGSFSRARGGGQFLSPEECAAQAADLVGQGFRTIKLRLGIREENADPEDDPALPCARAVRRAIGPDVALYVDANNGYRAARAIRVGRALAEECGVSLLEEPVAAYQYAALAEVAAALDIDVAAGEHEYTRWAFRDLVLHGRVDVLNPDVSKLGGLSDALRVAALAELFDKPISVHNARPTLLSAAHLHFVAATLMADRPQEHPGTRRLAELWQFFENRIEVAGGFAAVPLTPGLGLVPNEKAIRAAAR
jgi:L-alanine-DL-glutamate epimerase-like enolase superfamily enzyme